MIISATVQNPVFSQRATAVFAKYDKLARDISDCLHQVTTVVSRTTKCIVGLGVRHGSFGAYEKLSVTTMAGNSVVVQILESAAHYTQVDGGGSIDEVLEKFAMEVASSNDQELVNITSFYWVFLRTVLSGMFNSSIEHTKTGIIFYVQKRNKNHSDKVVTVKIELKISN